LAKIAIDVARAIARRNRDGSAGRAESRVIATDNGWSVADVVCTSGPHDRPFEECHRQGSIAMVVAGSFEYRSSRGQALMIPGSLMLGNAGEGYECGHRHGTGDRCVAFWYAPEYIERIAAEAESGHRGGRFTTARVPPIRQIAPFVARASTAIATGADTAWEELGLALAAEVVAVDGQSTPPSLEPSHAVARVSEIVRTIEQRPDAELTLGRLARLSGLSPFHFLGTFERLTGVTPHQYILRARLRDAALQLADAPDRVVDIAFASGFGDVSNFNRAFRAELGVSPRAFRRVSG
jgi:AraC family transcriptional regulator